MARPLAVDLAVGQAMERLLYKRQELVQGRFIAVLPFAQQPGDEWSVVRRLHGQMYPQFPPE